MKENGFYIIKEDFFKTVNDPYLKTNKGESRPHYYCLKDNDSDIYWMIPMSSRVDKYEKIIIDRIKKKQPCDILHITKLGKRKSVFLIQDMFPITSEYVERAYTINNIPFILTREKDTKAIHSKAERIKALICSGRRLFSTQPDALKILSILKEKRLRHD